MERKKLGILGGMGPEATQVLYKNIIDHTEVTRDQEHLDIVIYSHASIPDRTAYILSGREEELKEILLADVRLLRACGCEFLAVPCNTSHYFAPALDAAMDGNFINMITETANYVAARGFHRAGIMATDGTVRNDLYRQALNACGVEAVYPDSNRQRDVMSLIYDQIKAGEKGNHQQFFGVVKSLKAAGCDCVVLACTELSVFRNNYQLGNEYFVDALDVLTQVCITRCGGAYL